MQNRPHVRVDRGRLQGESVAAATSSTARVATCRPPVCIDRGYFVVMESIQHTSPM
jgi:hypothetical protein